MTPCPAPVARLVEPRGAEACRALFTTPLPLLVDGKIRLRFPGTGWGNRSWHANVPDLDLEPVLGRGVSVPEGIDERPSLDELASRRDHLKFGTESAFDPGEGLSGLRKFAPKPSFEKNMDVPNLADDPGFCTLSVHGDSSRCTAPGEKAGRQTAMYSAPSGPGVLYLTRSPA